MSRPSPAPCRVSGLAAACAPLTQSPLLTPDEPELCSRQKDLKRTSSFSARMVFISSPWSKAHVTWKATMQEGMEHCGGRSERRNSLRKTVQQIKQTSKHRSSISVSCFLVFSCTICYRLCQKSNRVPSGRVVHGRILEPRCASVHAQTQAGTRTCQRSLTFSSSSVFVYEHSDKNLPVPTDSTIWKKSKSNFSSLIQHTRTDT